MERAVVMVMHSAIIGIVLYFIMTVVLKQNPVVAENRSVIIACLATIYMVLFGHGMPTKLNKNIL